jgi:nucleoid-associated protein YgaU
VLVLRKEIKIGIGAGLTILGIAGVYGLMASLSSSGAEKADQTAIVTDDKGLDSATSGLPPKDETPSTLSNTTPPKLVDAGKSTDPFSESNRPDGNLSNDAILSALATGRIGDAKVKDQSKPVGGNEPTVIKAPTTPKTDSKLVNGSHEAARDSNPISESSTKSGTVAVSGKYTIKAGDTFSTISEKMYGNKKYAQTLVKANPDVNPNRLKIGKEITVPPKEQVATIGGSFDTARTVLSAPIDATKQYRVAPGDTLSHISQKLYGKSTRWQAIYDANKAVIGSDEARLKVGMLLDLPEKPVR